MTHRPISKLNPKKRYLQVALNSTLEEAQKIIKQLPLSSRIILEAGTPLIKKYGEHGIRQIRQWYEQRLLGQTTSPVSEITSHSSTPETPQHPVQSFLSLMLQAGIESSFKGSINEEKRKQFRRWYDQYISSRRARPAQTKTPLFPPPILSVGTDEIIFPYVVADLKTMDRGETEVEIAQAGGASAAIALGTAPIETLNSFIESCEKQGLDAMIDMMNVEYPLSVLRALKKTPPVVILHRGVDEERLNKEKQIPLHEIRRIKGNYNIMISIAGGDTLREVQRSIFNDADIVVIWKSVFHSTDDTIGIIKGFLKEIK